MWAFKSDDCLFKTYPALPACAIFSVLWHLGDDFSTETPSDRMRRLPWIML